MSELQRRSMQFPLGGGLDTKTDPFQVGPHKLLGVSNGIFTKTREVEQRHGYQPLSKTWKSAGNARAITNGLMVAPFKNERLIADLTQLYSWSPTITNWLTKGRFISAPITLQNMVADSNAYFEADATIDFSGLRVTAFVKAPALGGGIYYTVSDASGRMIVSPTLLGSGQKPRLIVSGSNEVLICYYGGNNAIRSAAISVLNPTAAPVFTNLTTPGTGTTFDVVGTNPSYDLTIIGPIFVLAFLNNAASGGAVTVNTYLRATTPSIQNTLQLVGSVARATTNNPCPVTVCSDGTPAGNICVYWTDSTGGTATAVQQAVVTQTLGATLFAAGPIGSHPQFIATMGAVAVPGATPSIWLVYDSQIQAIPGPSITPIYVANLTTSAYTIATQVPFPADWMALASLPFIYNGTPYVCTVYQDDSQDTYFVSDLSGNAIAKILYGEGGGFPTISSVFGAVLLPQVSVASSKSFLFPVLLQNGNSIPEGDVSFHSYNACGVALCLLSMNDTANGYQRTQIGNEGLFAGGFVWGYDGQSITEHGFHLNPEIVDATLVADMTSELALGTQYSYIAVWAWIDAANQTHFSAPSAPAVVTTDPSTKQRVEITVKPLPFTYKENVQLFIYRTCTLGNEPGIIFYLNNLSNIVVASAAASPPYAENQPALNDPSAASGFINFWDFMNDNILQGNPQVYTTGGVLPNGAPDSSTNMLIFDNRAWALDFERKGFWYSQTVVPGAPGTAGAALSFSQELFFNVDPRGGLCVGGATTDEKMFIFKERQIFYTAGTGPDEAGRDSQYLDPVLASVDCGCLSARSIISMPVGIMFQSQKGIFLMGRGLDLKYIGADVEGALEGHLVTSAALIPNTTQVRYTLDNGTLLMYDYFVEQWAVHGPISAIDGCVCSDLDGSSVYNWIDASGTVWVEDEDNYLDGTTGVDLSIETGWYDFGQMAGFDRIWRFVIVGHYVSPHLLTVETAYDHVDQVQQTNVVSPVAAQAAAGSQLPYGGGGNLYQWLVRTNKQKTSAFKFTLTTSRTGSPPDSGAGGAFSAVQIDFGVEEGGFRVPSVGAVG